jgi:CspA family cold shock protein
LGHDQSCRRDSNAKSQVRGNGSKDAFVHISAVERAGLSTLSEGQKVSYELQAGQNGKSSAENLSVIE